MKTYLSPLSWLEEQHADMRQLLNNWTLINSGSSHLEGLAKQHAALTESLKILGGIQSSIDLPPYQKLQADGELNAQAVGQALRIQKRPQAPLQVLLCGHMDTVYAKDSPFQQLTRIDNNTLNGPGVADMKGGIVVMLYALLAVERSPFAKNVGWQMLLTADEEIGSLSSGTLLSDAARTHHLGLVYEPTTTVDGCLAGARKGSGKFSFVAHGKAAHAGREFAQGRNAISAMARIIQDVEKLNQNERGLTINVGHIGGGNAVNIVPHMCICHLDVRYQHPDDASYVEQTLKQLAQQHSQQEGINVELHGQITRPVKPLQGKTLRLFQLVANAGEELGLDISWHDSGGCCDGNNLAAAGLPVVDSLGVRGGHIHSADEFILLDSLVERAQLSSLLLMKLASGDYTL